MNTSEISAAQPELNIAAVERDTGIGKDTLRVWERRYGFPQPTRDANDERLYPAAQVNRLRLVKRLMDQGHRPGRLLSIPEDELLALATASAVPPKTPTEPAPTVIRQVIDLLLAHDTAGLRLTLNRTMLRQGLQHFITDTVAPLNRAVGEAWMRGELQVFEEHLYSEQIKALLRQAIGSLPGNSGGRPRILLTTVPEEQHVLGLLMAECLLTLEGAVCISLGTQTPLFDIARAAEAHHADVVALSFSTAFPTRQTTALLVQLRNLLVVETALWAGGGGSERLPSIPGITLTPTLNDALTAVRDWHPPT